MAAANATQHHHRRATLVLSAVVALLLGASPMATTTRGAVAAAAASGCEGDKFATGKSYAHCAALPYLGAKLHWTYDAKTGSLSVAFVAKPPTAGWVSWAVNPTGDGMKGAQALLAFKNTTSSSTYVVRTYNVTGYAALPASSTRIAYDATELAADESAGAGGEVRMYGKLQLGPGMEKVNHIWQVGSTVTNGAPAKHAFDKANLEAKGTLVLSGAVEAVEASPAPAPAGGSPATKGGSGGGAASSGEKSAAAAVTTYVSAPVVLTLLALAAGVLLAM